MDERPKFDDAREPLAFDMDEYAEAEPRLKFMEWGGIFHATLFRFCRTDADVQNSKIDDV